ncbi:MAG: MgtC/SapB family protein [Clostridia bacterium]|nr:MgtC/SapB family protein [Clostridia bacterium]
MNTLAEVLHNQFSWLQMGEFFLRIVFACICGACIGVERSKRFKEAGIRTHIMVCFAAALMMIVSKYAFGDIDNKADPARIAAQVVTGVSFLGAGVIFRNGATVKGLTTAAGIWATSGIGLAVGAGMYVIGGFATVVIVLLQFIMHKVQVGVDAFSVSHLQFTVLNDSAFRQPFLDYLKEHKTQIAETRMEAKENGEITYDLILRVPRQVSVEDITEYLMGKEVVKTVSILPGT